MSELDYWNGRLLKGAISRREFMGRAAALGASSVAISTMLASADAIAAETPKKGGVLRLGLGGGSTTDSIDVTSYNDSVMIDTGHGLFDGLVEWGQDGRPHPRSRRELRAEERREGLGLQSAQGDQVLERPGIHRRRRNLLAQPASGRHQVRRRSHVQAGHRHQEARQVSNSDFARRAGRRPALRAHRLPRAHGAGWLQGLGEAGRDRRLQPRQVRSRRAHLAQEDPRLLEAGSRLARRRRGHRHQRRLGAAQRADLRPDRRHQPRRPQGGGAPVEEPQDPDRARLRAAGTRSWPCSATRRPTTIPTSAWR